LRSACMTWQKIYGAPGGIRTPNPQIRSLVLCPIELRARKAKILNALKFEI
jgi:hypothetical protein